eukprot:scaffold103843_cov42-Prasinocladus_malaysianus.AAC.1
MNVFMHYRSAYPYFAAHWGMVYDALLEALERLGGQVHFGKKVVRIEQGAELQGVEAVLEDGSSASADLVLAADGPHSRIQSGHFPRPEPLRYAERVAWRGVVQRERLPGEVLDALAGEYPDLGNCLYFIVGDGQHVVLYELGGGLINWLLYVNRDKPLFDKQTTGEPPEGMLRALKSNAEADWGVGLGGLIRATAKPFANDIYDRDGISSYVHGKVALVGDSAHPITPHMAKGTNLALQDAYVLCHQLATSFREGPPGNTGLGEALETYDMQRRPEGCRMVAVSRHMGRVRNSKLSDGRSLGFADMSEADYLSLMGEVGVDISTLPLDPFLLRTIRSKEAKT